METNENQSGNFSWLKNSILPIIVIIIVTLYLNDKINTITVQSDTNVPSKVILDFQNKTGVARIKTSFTEILVASAGSKKRDDGYEVLLHIINPSSIPLRNITGSFQHTSSTKTATCTDLQMTVYPGKSRVLKCFIADLTDSDLKSVEVSVDFDQISHY